MLEILVVALFISFVLLPCVGSEIIGRFASYKDSWIVGNSFALGLTVFAVVMFVILGSIFYLFDGGLSLSEHFSNLIK